MKILLSIKPEYAEKIFNGTKKFEYRKVIFKNPDVRTVIVYVTKPVGKIIGEFEIEKILTDNPNDIWEKTKEYSGIKKSFFNKYFEGRDKAYAIKIASIKEYSTPICPSTIFKHFYAPQSFMYFKNELKVS